ncbi:MAG: hypothetical protein KGH94_02475 [Candidatus Micrarchaeota archaeon]|nr:hypothetical protein [Candidatus Micrarchaeota archaeon]
MKIRGLCHMCGAPATSECRMCGKLACKEHMGTRLVCNSCAAGRKI